MTLILYEPFRMLEGANPSTPTTTFWSSIWHNNHASSRTEFLNVLDDLTPSFSAHKASRIYVGSTALSRIYELMGMAVDDKPLTSGLDTIELVILSRADRV